LEGLVLRPEDPAGAANAILEPLDPTGIQFQTKFALLVIVESRTAIHEIVVQLIIVTDFRKGMGSSIACILDSFF